LASTSALLGGNNLGIHLIDTDLESQAVFGQLTYIPEFLDSRLSLTGGLRYTEEEREAVRAEDPANPSIQFFSGQNSLSYDRIYYTLVADYSLTDEMSAYLRTATGYRAGGAGERTLNVDLTFEEEDNVSYEIGLKSEFLDRRLRVNAAAFVTDYDNLVLTISG